MKVSYNICSRSIYDLEDTPFKQRFLFNFRLETIFFSDMKILHMFQVFHKKTRVVWCKFNDRRLDDGRRRRGRRGGSGRRGLQTFHLRTQQHSLSHKKLAKSMFRLSEDMRDIENGSFHTRRKC